MTDIRTLNNCYVGKPIKSRVFKQSNSPIVPIEPILELVNIPVVVDNPQRRLGNAVKGISLTVGHTIRTSLEEVSNLNAYINIYVIKQRVRSFDEAQPTLENLLVTATNSNGDQLITPTAMLKLDAKHNYDVVVSKIFQLTPIMLGNTARMDIFLNHSISYPSINGDSAEYEKPLTCNYLLYAIADSGDFTIDPSVTFSYMDQ